MLALPLPLVVIVLRGPNIKLSLPNRELGIEIKVLLSLLRVDVVVVIIITDFQGTI